VYVALGASDTVGVGATTPTLESWPLFVHAGLPPETRLVNLGISGAILRDVIEQQLPVAQDARPSLVSIWPGVNDLRAGVPLTTFTTQLDTILQTFKQQSSTQPVLVVLNMPDLRRLPAFRGINAAMLDTTVREWNAAIAEIARRHDAILVDLYAYGAELVDHPEYLSADGFHPSSAGYRRIADIVLAELETHATTVIQ
jgi:lysophospholipase L1-like esterase